MLYVDLVAILAVIQFLLFVFITGRARAKSGLKAPAISGDENFERMYRVQMNTLEMLIAFLPALYLAAKYWSPFWLAVVGCIYLIGRHLYWRAYIKSPATRGLGFALTIIPTSILAVSAIIGIFWSLMK